MGVKDDAKQVEIISANYDIDKMRKFIKDSGFNPTDTNVVQLAKDNLENPAFLMEFTRSSDDINNEIDEIARKMIGYGKAGLPKFLPNSNEYIDYALDKVTKSIASTLGLDEQMASDYIDKGKALLERGELLDDAIETEASYKYNADKDWLINGLKQLDLTGFMSSTGEDAMRINEMIMPQYDESGKQTNPWYNERLGHLLQEKFIEYSQSKLSQGAEALTGLLVQAPYFMAVGGITGGMTSKTFQWLSKVGGKNPGKFANALKTVASNGSRGMSINYFKESVSTGQKIFNIGANIGHKAISDGLMFAGLALPGGEDLKHSFVDGALFGVASGIGHTAGSALSPILKDSNILRGVVHTTTSGSVFAGGTGLVALSRGEEYSISDAVKEFSVGALLPLIQNYGAQVAYMGAKTGVQAGKVYVLDKQNKKQSEKNSHYVADVYNKVLDKMKDSPELKKILSDVHKAQEEAKLSTRKEPEKDTTTGKTEEGRPIPEDISKEEVSAMEASDPSKQVAPEPTPVQPGKREVTLQDNYDKLTDFVNSALKTGSIEKGHLEAYKEMLEIVRGKEVTEGEMISQAVKDGWFVLDKDGNWQIDGNRIWASIKPGQRQITNSIIVNQNLQKALKESTIKKFRANTEDVFSGLESKEEMVREVGQLLKVVEEMNVLPKSQVGELKAKNTPSLEVGELKDLYTIARIHAYEANKILKIKDIDELYKQFKIFDNGEVDKHPGYDGFFKGMNQAYMESGVKANPVEAVNRVLEIAKEIKYSDDFVNTVRERIGEFGGPEVQRVIRKFTDDPDANISLRGLHRFAQSFRPYSGNNLRNLAFFYNQETGLLKTTPIQKVDKAQVGEPGSFLNEVFGDKIIKVPFEQHNNKTKERAPVDFAALPKEDKISLIRQARSKGYHPLFTKGSDTVMYFGKLHEKLDGIEKPAGKDATEFFQEKLKAEIGDELYNKVSKLSKRQEYFENDAQYYQHALNNHYYLQDVLGENYIQNEVLGGGLKNIVDVLKRFQIPASKGSSLAPGEFRGEKGDMIKVKVLEDSENSEAWRMYGNEAKELPLEATDGALLVHPKVFDRLKQLFGVEKDAEVLKAFWHHLDPEQGAIGFKMGVFKASPKQAKYMDSEGVEMTTFSSVTKYLGSRKVGDTVEADITKMRYIFAEHLDGKLVKNREKGHRVPSKVNMNLQFMNAIAIDPKDPTHDGVYRELSSIWDKNLDNIQREVAKVYSDAEYRAKFIDNVMNLNSKREYLDDAGRDQRLDIQAVTMATSTTDKILQAMPNSYFAQNIPWTKNYVRSALNNYFYKKLARPEVDGHMCVLRESSEYYDKLTDDTLILGHQGRFLGVPCGTYKDGKASYNRLGDVYDAYTFLKGKVKDNITIGRTKEWKELVAKFPNMDETIKYKKLSDLDQALNIVIARSPQENISGARALKLGGFAGEGSGIQVMVNKKNMNALGGADVDIDKVALMNMGDKKYLFDYVKDKAEWTQGVDTDAEIRKAAQGKLQDGPESIYDIESQIDAITRNIDGSKNIAKVASLMKVFNIAYAQDVNFAKDLGVTPLSKNSILSSHYEVKDPTKPYDIVVLGSHDVERLYEEPKSVEKYSGRAVEDTKDYIHNMLEQALEKNPNARLVVPLERGISEIALQSAIELNMDVKVIEPSTGTYNPIKALDYKRLNDIAGDRRTIIKTDRNNKYKDMANMGNEVWTMNIDRFYSDRKTPIVDAVMDLDNQGKTHVDLVANQFRTGMETTSKEQIDQTFKYFLRYAVDSGKYGGMDSWPEVQGQIFSKIFDIQDPYQATLFANLVNSPGKSKMSLIRETVQAISRNRDPETGKAMGNGRRMELISKYRKVFPEPKTAMEWGIHKTLDQDFSLVRTVDPAKMKNVIYGEYKVSEGGFNLFKFLNEFGYRTDASINKAKTNNIEGEVSKFVDTLSDKMVEGFIKTHKIPNISERAQLEQALIDNPNYYKSGLRYIKDMAEDFIVNDIHNATSKKMWLPLRKAVEKQYKGDFKRAHAEMDAIDAMVKELRLKYNNIWNSKELTVDEKRDQIDQLVENELKPNAYINPSDARTDWFWFKMIDALGQRQTNTPDTPFSSDMNRSAFLFDEMPLAFLKKYARVADDLIKEVSQEQAITTMVADPMLMVGQKGLKKLKSILSKKSPNVSSKLYNKSMKVIDDFVNTFDSLPEVVTGKANAAEWFESVTGRPAETLDRSPLSKREITKLVDSALELRAAEKFMKDPSEQSFSEWRKKYKAFRLKTFLPVSSLSKIDAGRRLYDNVMRSTHESEASRAYLRTTFDKMDKFLREETKLRIQEEESQRGEKLSSNEKEQVYRNVNLLFRDLVESTRTGLSIDAHKGRPIEDAFNMWSTTDPHLGEAPVDFLHNILQATREMKQEYLRRKVARSATSKIWGAKFLGKSLEEVEEMEPLVYYSEIESTLNKIFSKGGQNVGKIKEYYPRHLDDNRKREMMKTWIAEDELWNRLHEEGGITKEEFEAISIKLPESGHSRKRTIEESDNDINMLADLNGYLDSVIHPWNRMKTMMHGEEALTELMKHENNPDYGVMTKEMVNYVKNTLQHTLQGSKKSTPSIWDDVMTGTSNMVFGTVIGLNVASGLRNASQKSFALADVGWSTARQARDWKNGATPLAVDENGNAIRTYEDVSRLWGVEHGLTQHVASDAIERNVDTVMRVVRLEYEADQVKDQIDVIKQKVNAGDIARAEGESAIKKREKYIESLSKQADSQEVRDRIINFTREFAESTSSKSYLGLLPEKINKNINVPFSFAEIEKGNRLYSGRLGYFRAYKAREAEYRRLNQGNIDPVEMDRLAHEAGLEGARSLIALTQYEYHSFNTPEIMRSPTGRALLQFKTFTWNWLNMMHTYMRPALRKIQGYEEYGYDHLRPALYTGMMIGAYALIDEYLFGGAGNYWQTEPIDKTIDLVKFIAGDEDAAFGKGLYGYATGSLGPVFQPAFDALYMVSQQPKNSVFWGQRDSWDYNFHKKYGIFGDALATKSDPANAVGVMWAGPTLSGLYYDVMKKGTKNPLEILAKRVLGIRPRWYYSKKGKKRPDATF